MQRVCVCVCKHGKKQDFQEILSSMYVIAYVSIHIYVKTVKIIFVSIVFLCQWNLLNIIKK